MRTLSGINQRLPVKGVANGLVRAADFGRQAGGNSHTRRVICRRGGAPVIISFGCID
jgi:hypothetical protein